MIKSIFLAFIQNHYVKGYMRIEFENGDGVTKVIVKSRNKKGLYTPSGTARDCGTYYIVAKYDGYDKVDKETLLIEKDVEDK